MDAGRQPRHLLAFAALSASYFAHIGFFNPYLPLWLQSLGLPIFTISLLTSVQSFTRVFAPYAWGALSDHLGDRVKLLRISAAALSSSAMPSVRADELTSALPRRSRQFARSHWARLSKASAATSFSATAVILRYSSMAPAASPSDGIVGFPRTSATWL